MPTKNEPVLHAVHAVPPEAVAQARTTYDNRVTALRATKVQPRDIDATVLIAALAEVRKKVVLHIEAFREFDLTLATLEAMQSVADELGPRVALLPPDYRALSRSPQSQKLLQKEAYELLGTYTAYLDRKARGPVLRDTAHALGLGERRGRSVESLEAAYRRVLHAAQDLALCALLSVKPVQIATLQAMHGKLVVALSGKGQRTSVQQEAIDTADKLQMVLELFYQDVGAAAEWCLNGDARLQVVSLLPRNESIRRASKAVEDKEPAGDK